MQVIFGNDIHAENRMGWQIVRNYEKSMAGLGVKEKFNVKDPLVFHDVAVGSGEGGVGG